MCVFVCVCSITGGLSRSKIVLPGRLGDPARFLNHVKTELGPTLRRLKKARRGSGDSTLFKVAQASISFILLLGTSPAVLDVGEVLEGKVVTPTIGKILFSLPTRNQPFFVFRALKQLANIWQTFDQGSRSAEKRKGRLHAVHPRQSGKHTR